MKITSLAEAIDNHYAHILVYGRGGTGKTTQIAGLDGNIGVISCEKGLVSLKRIIKENPDLSSRCRVAEVTSPTDINQAIDVFSKDCDWIVTDSLTEIAEMLLRIEKKKPSTAGNKQHGQAAYGAMAEAVLDFLHRLRSLPVNLLLICHEEPIEVRISEDLTKTTYAPAMPGNVLPPKIPYIFDEVYRIEIKKDDTRVMHCQINALCEAKSRLGANKTEEADIGGLVERLLR